MRARHAIPGAGAVVALVGLLALPRSANAAAKPDFEFFKAKVEPVLQTVCAQCHAGKGKGRLALIVHAPGAPFPDAEHRRNYDVVLKLVEPGNPDRSPFLQKPLAGSADGVKHDGGDRIFRGTPTYRTWVDFIQGVTVDPTMASQTPTPGASPPPAKGSEPEPPLSTVGDKALVVEAETMTAVGDVAPADAPGANGRVVAPGASGGRLTHRFRVNRTGVYGVSLRAAGARKTLTVRVDGGEPLEVRAAKDTLSPARPEVVCDAGRPFEATRGSHAIADGSLRLEGAPARVLFPADVGHTRIEVRLAPLASDASMRLLFDVIDVDNGKFVGLSGARTLEIGVVEGGRPRVLGQASVPDALAGERLAIEYVSGIAVARVDGKPLLHVNFDRALGAGRFGLEARGVVVVRELSLHRGDVEAHRMRLGVAGVVALRRGEHLLEVSLPPGGPSLDSITLEELVR